MWTRMVVSDVVLEGEGGDLGTCCVVAEVGCVGLGHVRFAFTYQGGSSLIGVGTVAVLLLVVGLW